MYIEIKYTYFTVSCYFLKLEMANTPCYLYRSGILLIE